MESTLISIGWNMEGPPWGEHLKGVMQESGYTGQGLDLVVSSDVPVGAGLSSSAALEIALAGALVALSRTDWDPVATALACQRAENDWVGTQSGIMDQLVVANAVAGLRQRRAGAGGAGLLRLHRDETASLRVPTSCRCLIGHRLLTGCIRRVCPPLDPW